MLYLKILIVIIFAVALDSQVPTWWEAFRYVDMTLLVTVYFALMRDPVVGMLTGFVAGLAGDLAPGAGPVVGVGGFSKTSIGYLIATIAVRFSLESAPIRVLIIAVSSLANSALFIVLHGLMGQSLTQEAAPERLVLKVLIEATANLVAGVGLFWVLDRIFPENAPGGAMKVRRRFYD
ncbi:MAG: rod shape-determining protein MreD [Acidobacteria bacterium]|nr:rod shape-determining protein MreD [Acidobacteriota bacterium]